MTAGEDRKWLEIRMRKEREAIQPVLYEYLEANLVGAALLSTALLIREETAV